MLDFTDDGRKRVGEIYSRLSKLVENGWTSETIYYSTDGRRLEPIISFRTGVFGKALYLISGIHGEEPSGPNALASSVDLLLKLGRTHPIVLIPLCNPVGYSKDWRHVNQYRWTPNSAGESVNDTEHLMLDGEDRPRAESHSCLEALQVNNYFISLFKKYVPQLVIDFHEDEVEQNGAYLYSHGRFRNKDPIAKSILRQIRRSGISVKNGGSTRWDEEIRNGFVRFVTDSSIDDLFAADRIFVDGKIVPGPNAETVLALEIPGTLPLSQRVRTYQEVIALLPKIV